MDEERTPVDVVWLKNDVRMRDHGPFGAIESEECRGARFVVMYVYERGVTLSHPTMHGSVVAFRNEGLRALDESFRELLCGDSGGDSGGDPSALLCVHAESAEDALCTLRCALEARGLGYMRRVLAHEETGNWTSYMRDKRVRRWCRKNGIELTEFCQSGVPRGLRDRSQFTKRVNEFLSQPQHANLRAQTVRERLLVPRMLGCGCGIRSMESFDEIPREHRIDRPERQRGGEQSAVACMESFLTSRAQGYSAGISSPLTAATSGSRLSAYLTAGHISWRHVVQALQARQDELRRDGDAEGGWLKSLSAFSSRMRWRPHFITKLETEPEMEWRAQCTAFDAVRTQTGDWDADIFRAWRDGLTGYPMVDACMRCLLRHGWVNFRMRAMLVSFACYNCWLDWRGIEAHLARTFLDFEPGIHYPQLQMQVRAFFPISVKPSARVPDRSFM